MPRGNPLDPSWDPNQIQQPRTTPDGYDPFGVGEIRRQQASGKPPTVKKANPGGMAEFYDDSWKILSEGLRGGRSLDQVLGEVLAGFKGNPGDLEDWLEQARPFMGAAAAGQLKGTEGFKFMQDPGNWDLGAMGSYAPAAGKMAQGAAQGLRSGQNMLAASGLGRSSARAGMRQRSAQALAGQQGDLWSRVNQQAQQNRMQSAMNAMDAHRTVAQLALGMSPNPRTEMGQGGGGDWLSGMGAGAGIGGAIGGPVGAGIGAGLGGLVRLFGG